ncbi:Putative beta-glucuronidase [Paraconexibacter sp. AEG42_29]|uniref:Beta-glucuronidase n=1 Tax=Paraconexibacter sp. AEG42_29 TaxID=2997339 RepID=A0AAU7B0L3_9ACTN
MTHTSSFVPTPVAVPARPARRHRLVLLPLLLALLATVVVLPQAPAHAAGSVPNGKPLYEYGPSGRILMNGSWLFRLDKAEVGLKEHFEDQTGTAGWSPVKVPNAWNATDESLESFQGSVGWYRKDFRLPSADKSLSWVVRLESVNYRSRVFLNGTAIGSNRGAYLPFEIRLPNGLLKRSGTNRLVVRVENHRFAYDFPPAGLSVAGAPTGGWWNYGGLLREVYLRKVEKVDFSRVLVRPTIDCTTCDAKVKVETVLRNAGPGSVTTRVTGTYGTQKLDLGSTTISAGGFRSLSRTITVRNPKLWAPGSPNLYTVRLAATVAGKKAKGKKAATRRTLQSYFLRSGIRSVKVVDGKWLLNGRALNFRGLGMHEDDPKLGFAINNKIRDREVASAKELGATMVRSHYPIHPYTLEQLDKQGIMNWSEIPVYSVRTTELKKKLVRDLAAKELASNITENGNHASIVVWSVGNELSSRPGAVQGAYLAKAAKTAKRMDPTRPVGYAVAGYPAAGCQAEYAPLDVLGINEYFGWYPGPNGQVADRTLMSAYLDTVHACYPKKALVITETGAEANRSGPVEEKGTYEFQQDFVNYHFGVYATKPWLAGAMYWAMEEFRVRPGWQGGNPRPNPPIHEKGLITFAGVKKPAWFDVQRIFKGTKQIRSLPPRVGGGT